MTLTHSDLMSKAEDAMRTRLSAAAKMASSSRKTVALHRSTMGTISTAEASLDRFTQQLNNRKTVSFDIDLAANCF